jgi:hypothetical protein
VESLILMLTHQSVRAGISDVSGLGLFAVRDFQTLILVYFGDMIGPLQAERQGWVSRIEQELMLAQDY